MYYVLAREKNLNYLDKSSRYVGVMAMVNTFEDVNQPVDKTFSLWRQKQTGG